MKKKNLIIGLLASLACATCFTACDLSGLLGQTSNSSITSSSVTSGSPIENAKAFINDMYKKSNEKTRVDYELPTKVTVGGVVYNIAWTVDVTAGVEVKSMEGNKVKIDVDEEATADVNYVLTGTISDGNGNSATVTFNRTVLQAPTVAPVAITSDPEENTEYYLYMYQVTKKAPVYFTGMDSGFYLGTTNYSEGQDHNHAVKVKAEAVPGKAGYFYLTFTSPKDNAKMYIGVQNVFNNGSWHDNAIMSKTNVVENGVNGTYEFKYDGDAKTMIATLDNVKSGSTKDTTDSKTASFFLGTDENFWTIGAMNVDEVNKADACVAKLVTMQDKTQIPAETKIAAEKQAVNIVTAYSEAATVELPVKGTTHPDVTFTWSHVEGTGVSISGNTLTVTKPEAESTAKIKVVFNCGGETDELEITIKLVPALTDYTAIVDQAYALAENETLPGEQTLAGIITSVNDAYSEQHGNVTVTIMVAGRPDKQIKCYRLAGVGANTIKAGDNIVVKGSLTNYKGGIQFAQGCTIDSVATSESIVNDAYALADGATLPEKVMLSGVVTSVDTPYDAGYGNVTVTMQVGDMSTKLIKCFRVKGTGADKVAVGDSITVSGTIKNYGGTIEFDAGCIMESFLADLTPEEIVDEAYALAEGTSMNGAYTLTGIIKSIDTPYDSGYGNVTVTMQVGDLSTKLIKCYRLKGTGAESLGVGDEITVTGILKNHYGTIEFDQGCTLDAWKDNAEPEAPDTPDTTMTAEEILTALYALADGESLTGTFTLTGKITALDGYNNPTIVVEGFEDKPVYCYRLAVENVVDDVITVTATSMKNYMGTYEFMNCTLVTSSGEGETPDTPETPDVPETPDTPETPEEIVNAAYALASGASLSGTYTLTGIVISVDEAYNSQYGNVTVTIQVGNMTDKPIKCYRIKGTGAESLGRGDEITVSGIIKNYNGTIEFDAGSTLDAWKDNAEPVAPGGDIVIPESATKTVIDFGDKRSAGDHVNGNEVTAPKTYDGVLTITSATKLYDGEYDQAGNSCLKIGTSKVTGSFSFTVGENVDYVILSVAKYKSNTSIIDINGEKTTLTTNSTTGEYTDIIIDTTTVKDITVSSATGGIRVLIDSITLVEV